MMTSNLFDLSGRVALVVGASRGIGRGIAQGLAEAGRASRSAAAQRRIFIGPPKRYLPWACERKYLPADASRVPDIQALVGEVLARMGQIDILVNVAGVNRRKRSVEITEEDWDSVLALNLKALFFTSQAVGRYWIETRRFAPENKRGKGKIINIGSIAGEMGIRHVAPYAASKRGVVGVTSTLAVEWACEGICVNCLAPATLKPT